MAMPDAMQRPPRMSITNLASGRTVVAQFNPAQFEENVVANYNEATVPGLSHQPLQFTHTTNESFSFEMFFNAYSPQELEEIHLARRFLKSLCFPRAGAEDIAGGAPPRVLLVWPRMLSLNCVVRAVKLSHVRFNRQSQSTQFTASVQLSEIRDFRISSEDVFDDNQFRYGQLPGLDVPVEG